MTNGNDGADRSDWILVGEDESGLVMGPTIGEMEADFQKHAQELFGVDDRLDLDPQQTEQVTAHSMADMRGITVEEARAEMQANVLRESLECGDQTRLDALAAEHYGQRFDDLQMEARVDVARMESEERWGVAPTDSERELLSALDDSAQAQFGEDFADLCFGKQVPVVTQHVAGLSGDELKCVSETVVRVVQVMDDAGKAMVAIHMSSRDA